jgi:hypothetical protein
MYETEAATSRFDGYVAHWIENDTPVYILTATPTFTIDKTFEK